MFLKKLNYTPSSVGSVYLYVKLQNQVQNYHFKDVIADEEKEIDYRLFKGDTVKKCDSLN
ncbi:MAG: hypothetical protein KBT36_05465 [Kurthia sp.]|nr:hypothetical protein [Candidatus Kurthia equi]